MAQAGWFARGESRECAAKAGTLSAADAARIDEIEEDHAPRRDRVPDFLEERIGPARGTCISG